MKTRFVVALVAVFLTLPALCAENGAATVQAVAMQDCSGFPCVDVTVQGKRVRLLIDTGNITSVLDAGVARQLGLALEPIVRDGKQTGYSRARVEHLRIGGLELNIPVVTMDIAGFVSQTKMPKADGTLAYTAFLGTVLELDYPAKSVRVLDPATNPCSARCANLERITFGHHGPPILVASGFEIDQNPVRMQIDTLFGGTMLIYPTSVEKLSLSQEAKSTDKRFFPYTDGGVDMLEAQAASEAFQGSILQQNAPMYFATEDVHLPDGMFDGTVGNALMRNSVVTIDLQNMRFAMSIPQQPHEQSTDACELCLYGPDNMVFDHAGNMYLTDSDQKARSRVLKLSPEGKKLAEWHVFAAVKGHRNGPEGIALDAQENIYVTDAGTSSVLKLWPSGKVRGHLGAAASFRNLGHVAIAPSGEIYVSEGSPNLIHKFSARGRELALWHRERGSAPEQWNMPETIAVRADGNLAVEDWGNHRIEILSQHGHILKSFGSAGSGSGQFMSSAGLCVDARNHIYVPDDKLHRVQEFDADGTYVGTIANRPTSTLFERGPTAVAVDRTGALYSPDGFSIVKYSRDGRLLARWH